MTYLLDANVLIAATIKEHEHHRRAGRWLAHIETFATCPVTEGALVRFVMRIGERPHTALALLSRVRERPGAYFWTDDLSYVDVDLTGLSGHRQVTDTYLAMLARSHRSKVATFDRGLSQLHPGDVIEIPV